MCVDFLAKGTVCTPCVSINEWLWPTLASSETRTHLKDATSRRACLKCARTHTHTHTHTRTNAHVHTYTQDVVCMLHTYTQGVVCTLHTYTQGVVCTLHTYTQGVVCTLHTVPHHLVCASTCVDVRVSGTC